MLSYRTATAKSVSPAATVCWCTQSKLEASASAAGVSSPWATKPVCSKPSNRQQGTVTIPASYLHAAFQPSCFPSHELQSGTYASAVLAFRRRLIGIEPWDAGRGYSQGQVPKADTEIRPGHQLLEGPRALPCGHTPWRLEDCTETHLANCREFQDPCRQELFRDHALDPSANGTGPPLHVARKPLWSMPSRISHSTQKWGFHATSQR